MSYLNERSKRWFITLNNYSNDDVEIIRSTMFKSLCKYYIFGFEHAPKTGTKHIHLYLRLNKNMYKNSFKKIFPSAHIEVAKGDEVDCVEYCSKEGEYEEFGTRLKKTDSYISKVEKVKNMLDDLMHLKKDEFDAKYTYESFHHRNKLILWKYDHGEKPKIWNGDLKLKNIWIYGVPGCGKSRWAHQQAEQDEIYIKNVNKWWDGYIDGEVKLVIIEDFPVDDKAWLINILKIWADRYPFNGEIKGGTVRVTPGKWILIVTSNHTIEEVFKNCQYEDVQAIKRRFHEVQMVAGGIIQWSRISKDELDE